MAAAAAAAAAGGVAAAAAATASRHARAVVWVTTPAPLDTTAARLAASTPPPTEDGSLAHAQAAPASAAAATARALSLCVARGAHRRGREHRATGAAVRLVGGRGTDAHTKAGGGVCLTKISNDGWEWRWLWRPAHRPVAANPPCAAGGDLYDVAVVTVSVAEPPARSIDLAPEAAMPVRGMGGG